MAKEVVEEVKTGRVARRRVCEACHGEGLVTDWDGRMMACPECNGAGKIANAQVDRSPEGGDHEDGRHAKHESAVGNADAPNRSQESFTNG